MKKKMNVLSVIVVVILFISLFFSLKRQFHLSQYIKSKKVIVIQNVNKDSLMQVNVRVFFIQNKNKSFKYRYEGRGLVNFQNHFYFNKIGINLNLKSQKTVINQELAYFNDNIIPSATFAVSSRKYYKQGYLTILIKKPDQDIKMVDEKGEVVKDIEDNSGLLGIGVDKVIIMNEDQFGKTTFLHEICHSVGMYHVQDEFNIMYPYDTNNQIYFSEEQIVKLKSNLKKI